jgi:hypothetical protein
MLLVLISVRWHSSYPTPWKPQILHSLGLFLNSSYQAYRSDKLDIKLDCDAVFMCMRYQSIMMKRWRMPSSRMWRRVGLVRTDGTEERITSIISVFLMAANVPNSPILVTLIMEAIRSSETSVLTRVTRRHIPDDGVLHSHHRENQKSYMIKRCCSRHHIDSLSLSATPVDNLHAVVLAMKYTYLDISWHLWLATVSSAEHATQFDAQWGYQRHLSTRRCNTFLADNGTKFCDNMAVVASCSYVMY